MYRLLGLLAAAWLAGCGDEVSGHLDGSIYSGSPPPPYSGHFCELPGSEVHSGGGIVRIPGGVSTPDLHWLSVPDGFCVHYFGNVGNTRQLAFAPGGELFVASPTTPTTGGGPNGKSAIVVLPDDDRDGVADAPLTFLPNLPSTQGLLFTGGFLYYQDSTAILRVPYKSGDRAPSGPSQPVANISIYVSTGHWPKVLDVDDNGFIYVTNGGDQSELCDPSRPFHGGLLRLDGKPGGTPIAKGFRNPIAIRCQRGHDRCFVAELALDYSADTGGREKLVQVHEGDDWGFPCCATTNLPYMGVQPVPDCSKIAPESNSFVIGETPFGLDFDLGAWPVPWTNRIFVTLHGDFGTWHGARMVAVETDANGAPLPSTDLTGGHTPPGALMDFATGWDDGTHAHGRPAALAMAPDGRLFLGNDVNGDIVWIAPALNPPPVDAGASD
ncbi:MAG TPA: hypothetical protein VFF06_09605 [Polyangia bacterium]|nr:hypothetical protein [Polyangia bacterium]